MDLFERSWTALRTAVDELSDADWERPSGCTGWLVRDLVCHLVIDAQDVLITLVTPADTEPTADSTTYWTVTTTPPTGDDPLDALIPRLAAAYGEPRWLKHHFDDVGSAAGLAAARASLERIAGAPFPASFSDTDALLVGTGRRAPTATETAALGDFPAKLPLVIG